MFSAVGRNVLWMRRYALLYCSGKSYARMGSDISCRWAGRSNIENCRKLNRKQKRKFVTVLTLKYKILQAASSERDLHVSYFCFCFDNIGLYFYVLLHGSPTHPV